MEQNTSHYSACFPFPPGFLKSRYSSCFEFLPFLPSFLSFHPLCLLNDRCKENCKLLTFPYFLFIQPERVSYFRFRELNDFFGRWLFFGRQGTLFFLTSFSHWICFSFSNRHVWPFLQIIFQPAFERKTVKQRFTFVEEFWCCLSSLYYVFLVFQQKNKTNVQKIFSHRLKCNNVISL